MAGILDLPAELVLHITSFLHPRCQFRLALSCRRFYECLGQALQTHRSRYATHGTVRLLADSPGSTDPFSLLTELHTSPHLARYVDELVLPADAAYSYGELHTSKPRSSGDEEPSPSADELRLWRSSIETDPFLKWPERGTGDGDEDSIAQWWEAERQESGFSELDLQLASHEVAGGVLSAHLLTLCEELRSLAYVSYQATEWVALVLRRVGDAYRRRRREDEARRRDGQGKLEASGLALSSEVSRKRLPLENLTKVEFRHWDTEGCARVEWVFLLIRLPSVQELKAHMVGAWGTPAYGVHCPSSSVEGPEEGYRSCSGVKKLVFSSSNIEAQDWPELFREIKALDSFEYECGPILDAEWDASGVMRALEDNAGGSLKSLRLWKFDNDEVSFNEDPHPHLSLNRFEKLGSLSCAWRDIVPDPEESDLDDSCSHENLSEDGEPFDLANALPASLEFLGLRGCPEEESEVCVKMLQSARERLPNLKAVYVGGDNAEEFKALARKKGLKWKPSLGRSSIEQPDWAYN